MKENTVKNILIFFLVFLPLQYTVVGIIGVKKSEPWPAFVLPAFKSVYSTEDQIAVDQIQFYAQNNTNGTTTEISPAKLFHEVSGSLRQGFFRTHFSDSVHIAAFGTETRAWLQKEIKRSYPSLTAHQLKVQWKQKIFNSSAMDTTHYQTKITKQFSISLTSD